MTPQGLAQGPQRAQLDDADRALLAALKDDGRAPLAALGQAIGLSADAVRERLRRLEDHQLVRVVGAVAPAALDLQTFALVGIQGRTAAHEIAERLGHQDSIDYVVCTAGSFDLLAEVVCHDELELISVIDRHIRGADDVAASEVFLYLHVWKWSDAAGGRFIPTPGPETGAPPLDDNDRALLAVLRRQGRATYRELAQLTGLNYSTARRRTQILIESGVVRIVTEINDIVTGNRRQGAVGLRTSGQLEPLVERLIDFPTVKIVVETSGRFDVMLELAGPNDTQLLETIRAIRALDGVVTCETLPYLEILRLPNSWAFGEDRRLFGRGPSGA